jgi:hypothetical protein
MSRPTPRAIVRFSVKETVSQENFWLQGWSDRWEAGGLPPRHEDALRVALQPYLR